MEGDLSGGVAAAAPDAAVLLAGAVVIAEVAPPALSARGTTRATLALSCDGDAIATGDAAAATFTGAAFGAAIRLVIPAVAAAAAEGLAGVCDWICEPSAAVIGYQSSSAPTALPANAASNTAALIGAMSARVRRLSGRASADAPFPVVFKNPSLFTQLLQMRADRARRRRMQILGHVGVNLLDHRHHFARLAIGKRIEHLALAQFAMRDVLADFFLGLANYRPMRRIDGLKIELKKPLERIHVLAEVAGVIGNHRGAGAENHVAGEKRLLFFKVIAKMIGRVAGSVNRAQRDTVGANNRVVPDFLDGSARGCIMSGPRHLEHLTLAVLLAHLFHTADVIDMRMGEHDPI